jgi:hypothetical protein
VNQCEIAGGVCGRFTDTCPEGRYAEWSMGCPAGRSGQCCLPLGAEINLSVPDDGDTLEANYGDAVVLRLDRGAVVACEGGEWLESSIYNPDGNLHLIAHNIIPDDDCPGIGCYSEMDEYRFVFRDRGSSTVDFTIDQGPAPDFCDNTLRGTFRFQLVLP